MATPRVERHPIQQAWSASGSISLELSPKPYTITRMFIVVRPSITTTTATNYNDYWDRLISRLSLTGKGKTFMDFSNMRMPYHFSRFAGFGPRRPTVVADSATTLAMQFIYCFHFGIAPAVYNPITRTIDDNPFDLTGGIPPVESGNLNLGGTFAAASALGTNVTIADADFDVYLCGVQPDPGDAAVDYMPQAFPIWTMRTPTPTATSSAFATQDSIPGGDFLRSLLVMTTNGSNSPRDDSVLNSLKVFNQIDSREIIAYGGQSGAVLDNKAAEIISQFNAANPNIVASDNVSTAMTAQTGTPGVPVITHPSDSGLYWLPLYKHLRKINGVVRGHPMYGVDMRGVNSGDLQLRYGVNDATGISLDVLYQKYQLNPDHPANVGV